MDIERYKIKRSVKIYPIFSAFSSDLLFFVPIDTLYFTLVKNLTSSDIAALITISGLFCIIFQKLILKIIEKIGNTNSLKLGAIIMLLAIIFLTFGNSFVSMAIYRILFEVSFLFLNMSNIILKNNIEALGRKEDYFKIRNFSKILYAVLTTITAILSGYLFGINNQLPMYCSIFIYVLMLLLSFTFYEGKNIKNDVKVENDKNTKLKYTTLITFLILSNTIFYSIIKLGQSNSKLFIQYELQNNISIESVAYYLSIVVFISRIMRIIGNFIFGKIYQEVKEKISMLLTFLLVLAFLLLIIGYFIQTAFLIKLVIMSIGFFLILAIRDTFQVFIEDIALESVQKESQQKILMKLEIYRKIGTLILSFSFTLILRNYSMIYVIFILLILSIIEVFVNKKLYREIINKIK